MNKKGFTLIELLGVLVILALLASLTTLTVTNIVKKSKTELSDFQLSSIKSAAQIWGEENVKKLPETGECIYITLNNIQEQGLIDETVLDPSTTEEISDDIKIKISARTNSNGKSILDYEVNAENITECSYPAICTAVTTASLGNVPQGNYAYGDEYICEVKDDAWYTFFVLEENEEDSNKVDLILDSNINASGEPSEYASLVAWNENLENASNGPITAMTFLSSATSTWTNLDSIIVSTYNDGDEMSETFTTYAKLPKASQITGDENTAPWIFIDSLDYSWTSTSDDFDYTSAISNGGYIDAANNADEVYGIRPVITVTKIYLK